MVLASDESECPVCDCTSVGGNETWLADGYCDSINNNEFADMMPAIAVQEIVSIQQHMHILNLVEHVQHVLIVICR